MASDVVEGAALGRPFTLGMLYNSRTDKLIPGVTLCGATTLQVHDKYSSEFQISTTDSIEKKSSLLDVDTSLKASFLGGLIKVEGSAKYLNDKKNSHHQSRITVQYKATTKFKQLILTPDEIKNTKQAEAVKNLATHVITGILYGANAFFVFDSEKLHADSIQDIQGSMQAVIKKIPSFSSKGKADIKLNDEEKAVIEKFTCKFYGDFILESNPATFEDAVKTYIQLPKLLGEHKDNGVPLKIWMMPLNNLYPETVKMMTGISVGLNRKAEDAIEDLHNLEIRCNDLLEDSVVKSFPQIQEKLTIFQKLCMHFRSLLQQIMAKKLPSIRAGEEDEQELVKVFDERDKTPFSQDKLIKWIKNQEREVTIIRYFVDMMEGAKIISDQSELDREVFNPRVEEVLCFVFTSLKSTDPYLQNMSDYLDKPKLQKTEDIAPSTQDQWYFSDEVIAKMKKKAKAVKENRKLFHVAVIANDKYKGGSIYHYRDTILVTDDYSWPDVIDVENVTDRRALLLYACDLTLDPNTANYSLTLSERNKKVTRGDCYSYSDHSDRFKKVPQVLCREALQGRCYWEVELSACWLLIVFIGVCYKHLKRDGNSNTCKLGHSDNSWGFKCRFLLGRWYFLGNEGKKYRLPDGCPRLGVFLDWHAGTLSYYIVSSDKLRHLHTCRTSFSEPVYPGFRVWTWFIKTHSDSVQLML